jgi:hypothetical protein
MDTRHLGRHPRIKFRAADGNIKLLDKELYIAAMLDAAAN